MQTGRGSALESDCESKFVRDREGVEGRDREMERARATESTRHERGREK